jgi:hypothetical protein
MFFLRRASSRGERSKKMVGSAMMCDAQGNRLMFLADSWRKIASSPITAIKRLFSMLTGVIAY